MGIDVKGVDVSSMAEGCLAILNDPQLSSNMGKAAREHARNDFCARETNVASFWVQSVNWRRNWFAAAESRQVPARNLSTSSEKCRPESLSSGTASTTRFSGVWLVGSAAAVCWRE